MNSKLLYQSLPVQIVEQQNCVHIRRGVEHLKLSGEGVAGLVKHLVESCQNPVTRAQLYSERFAAADTDAVFEALLRHRFVLPQAEIVEHSVQGVESATDLFAWHFNKSGSEVNAVFTNKKFAVIGDNLLSRQLLPQLAAFGATTVTLIDDAGLRESMPDTFSAAGLLPKVERLETQAALELQAISHADLCIAAAPRSQINLLEFWNKQCLEHSIPFYPLFISNFTMYSGPLVIPGSTACFACLLQRDTWNENSLCADLECPTDANAHQLPQHGYHPAAAALCASIASHDLSAHYLQIPPQAFNRVTEVALLRGEMSRHPLLPSPLCPACRTLQVPQSFPRPIPTNIPPAEFIKKMKAELVDSLCGIATTYSINPSHPFTTKVQVYSAELSKLHSQDGDWNAEIAGAFSFDTENAELRTIGEAVERYASGIFNPETFTLTSFAEANIPCVDPAAFVAYHRSESSNDNLPFVPFSRDTVVYWIEGVDLNTEQLCFVPAQKVFCPYLSYPEETAICQPMSTGIAAHVSKEQAIISGVCEIIERDAVAVFWQSGMSPKRIDPKSLPTRCKPILKEFERMPAEAVLYDITTDVQIPVIMAAVFPCEPDMPAFTIAASCHFDAAHAAEKALCELLQTTAYVMVQAQKSEGDSVLSGKDVITMDDHSLYWADRRRLPDASFFLENPESLALSDLPSYPTGDSSLSLELIIEQLKKVGETIYSVDITPADVASLGFTVMSSVVPGLVPLQFGHHVRYRSAERFLSVPKALGYPEDRLHLHQMPHPFP